MFVLRKMLQAFGSVVITSSLDVHLQLVEGLELRRVVVKLLWL